MQERKSKHCWMEAATNSLCYDTLKELWYWKW
jgi:hypothetical protein